MQCSSVTNFAAMEAYFFHLFFVPDFRFYSFDTQALILGNMVCGQTLNNYKKKLEQFNFISEDRQAARYLICNSGKIPVQTTEKQHHRAWKQFFKRKEERNDAQAWAEMKDEFGGTIFRRYGFAENGIYQKELLELKQILRDLHIAKQEQEH